MPAAAASISGNPRRRRAWYTPEWAKRMEATHGVTPKVTYYDNHVVVDNETGEIRIDEA